MGNVKFTSHLKEYQAAFNQQVNNALEIAGGKAETYAKEECPVDTGRLRNSIGHKVDPLTAVYIGTNVKYAPFIEFGTGIYYNGGTGGRQSSWSYTNKTGEHATHGIKPREFLKKAIVNHVAEYKRILKDGLMGR